MRVLSPGADSTLWSIKDHRASRLRSGISNQDTWMTFSGLYRWCLNVRIAVAYISYIFNVHGASKINIFMTSVPKWNE